MIAILSASIVFALTKHNDKQTNMNGVSAAYAVQSIDGKEYSALLEQNVIFSVERVSIKDGTPEPDAVTFYGKAEQNGTLNPYVFYDINENGKSKQVVADGSLVMLENTLVNWNYVNRFGGSDSIMVSLGQYVYNNAGGTPSVSNPVGKIETPMKDTVCSQITYLKVDVTFNGEKIDPKTDTRYQIRDLLSVEGNAPYTDFLFLIKQDGVTNIEGHYQINFTYMKDGKECSGSFEFFVACKTSYEKIETINQQSYNSKPTLGWSEAYNFSEQEAVKGVVNYYEGKSGISNNVSGPNFTSTVSYPTLTYDYTRYKLDFYHTQNGEKTSYDVKFDKKSESLIVDSTNNVFDSNNVMAAYTTGDNTNLVTFVFTEIGFYQFDFEYIYIFTSMTGVNPSMDHLTIESKKLMIHGVDLNYSKQGAESAEFRKLQFSANQTAAVDLVVMNGVTEDKQDTLKNQNLGVLYSVDNTSYKLSEEKDVRVGEVILKSSTNRTEDTLQNNALVGATKNSQELASYILDISDVDFEENIATATNSMLKRISYINTNQGSIWISANESVNKIEDSTTDDKTVVVGGTPATEHKYKVVTGGSFYFYSKTQFDRNSFSKEIEDGSKISTARVYNNQTIFNDVGYYLVFIKIRADKLQTSTDDFYQVYAFKYTSDTIDITVKTADASETVVGAGGYTKQNVRISWVEPETFESKINAFFYQQLVTDNTAPMSRDELLTLQSYPVGNGTTVLGENVPSGAYSKYLIKLERAGKSATYKAFTIDRQNISGVVAQLVSQTISYGTKYYSYVINNDNNKIIISNGITDSFATMFWNEKISGAEISATYSFTPFIKNDVDNKLVATQEGERWIQTDYKLGVTQTGYVYSKNTEITDVGAYSVLNDQGIYVFTIKDEAGNGCKYVLIIDKTEGFIQVTNLEDNTDVEYLSGSYKLYGNSVKYDVGTHKTIELTQQLGKENEELTALLESNISNFEYGDYKIYNNGTYLSNLSSLFKYLNSNRYLAVKNTRVYIYDRDMEISNSSVTTGRIENSNKGSSLLRTIYVVSENNKFSSVYKNPADSKTWANIEVNLDNSRGMIYYGNTNFDVAGVDPFADLGSDNSGVLQRLFHSADVTNTNAGKDKYFAFTFLFGNAPYSVETIKYSYYKLDLNTFDSTADSASHTQTYFYTLENGDIVVYDKNDKDLEIDKTTDGTRGFYMFLTNHHDNTTKEGLYCVTRTYEGEAGADYGNDLKTVNYYFIVDRNGIIDVTNQIGTEIKINLLEDESIISGTDFTLVSSTPKTLSYNSVNEDYFTYLKTNKLPAVLTIPYSKYLNDGNSSKGYYAGRLKVSVYYKDVYGQISESNKPYLIYNGIVPQDEYKTSNEFFTIDIYNYLKNTNKRLADRICVSEENQNWICLKGEYVVVIEDNVQTTANVKTKKVIGFEINREEYPEVDVNLGFKTTELGESEQSGLAGNYKIITNKEYVQVILPKYYGTSKTAKVDDSYIYLKETFNGSVKFEGTYNYAGNLNGSDSNGWKSELTEDANGNRVLLLKTRLTDESGNVIVENLDKPLVYTIKIRYRIGDDVATSNKYENCYYYYDSAISETRVNYAYSTYTITIDRLAPTENVDDLIKEDELIKNGFVDDDLFETACYNPSLYYFTYQYKNYDYQNKNTLQNIYAFKVNSDTEIKGKDATGDLNKIFVKKVETDISDLTLTLPVLDLGSLGDGINVKEYEDKVTYGDIFEHTAGIYEVYEVDLAENVTHYVVIYNDAEPEFKINFKYSPAEGGEVTNGHIGTKQYAVYNVLGSTDEKDEDYLLKIDSVENLDDYFFNVTVRSNIPTWEPVSINTNFKDLKTDTFKDLFDKMNKYFGEYEVKITDRTGTTYTSIIHRYDKDNMKSLNVESLIVQRENGTYYIDLDRANRFEDGIFYYAKTVKVIVRDGMDYKETLYVCELKDGRYVYYIHGLASKEYVENIDCLKNTTYKIMITDVFGNQSAITFNTSGKEYYTLVPDQGFEYSTGIDGTIYSASNLTLEHDTIFTLSDSEIVVIVDNVSIKRDRFNEYFTTRISGDGKVGYIDLVAKQGKLGEVVKYHFQFRDNDLEIDRAFNIVIDTKTSPISFTEISGKSREYNFYQNKDISNIDNLNQYFAENSVDKIMNLAWEVETRDYFSYTYELYQKMKDGTIELVDTSNMSSIELVTKGEASGAYWFVISVLDKNNKLVGNKIYAFDVQPSNNKLVYVSKDNIAIERTTVFLKNELDGLTLKNEANEVLNCTKDRIDLYISNEELIVKKTRENIELIPYSTILKSTDAGDWVLTVWEVITTTHKDYLAIMQVPKTDMLVGKVYANVIGLLSTTGHELNREQSTVYANVDDEIAIIAQKLYAFDLNDPADRFASKNAISIGVAYEIGDEQLVIGNTVFDSEEVASGRYTITGNGNYKFTFTDTAGNIHKFTPEGRDFVNVYALREVVLTLNGKTPIENGYYNKQVELDVYASARFETASIKITAYRNNKEISVPQTLPCVISSYGNFKIVVTAKFKTDDNKIHDVSKTINFAIVNENEAKTTMDLTNFSNYEIVKVLNPMLEDVTDVFMREIVYKNQVGLMIAYSSIMENAESFGVTSGKLKFVITFKISDEIYPEFEHDVAFTLNNEIPKINCSLEPGETTKKGFEITFNPSIIYEQVGEAYITINDVVVYSIAGNPVNDLVSLTKTFKQDGDGDYYVKLVTASGTVLQSFKVEIKEPLNASAIIVIIVVVGVVLGVTITIIVLRRKMRIR